MDAALVMESEGWQWRGKEWVWQFREGLGMPYCPEEKYDKFADKHKPTSACEAQADLQSGTLLRGLHAGGREREAPLRDEARERGDGLRFRRGHLRRRLPVHAIVKQTLYTTTNNLLR